MKVKIKKLHPDAKMPIYGSQDAACFDLHAVEDGIVPNHEGQIGLAFEVPQGHVMMIYSRSGHGYKHGVRLVNCTGVIDADYRGEVSAKLTTDRDDLVIKKGDRIAQAMIVPVDRCEFEFVDELGDTQRGAGGFGSSGA